MLDNNHRFIGAGFNVLRNSGKTYTMMGSETEPESGLIHRICKSIFDNNLYKIELSYLEIYSEEINDLLSNNRPEGGLKVRQHSEFGPYVEGLTKIVIENYNQMKQLIKKGNRDRITASTLMNMRSSRSHAILTIYFTIIIADHNTGKTKEISSKINLVDLAGSEKVETSGVTGINFKEAITINKSLSTLGLVISRLGLRNNKSKTLSDSLKLDLSKLIYKNEHFIPDMQTDRSPTQSFNQLLNQTNKLNNDQYTNSSRSNNSSRSVNSSRSNINKISKRDELKKIIPVAKNKNNDHIPFRDSLLTWILKESLGGNSKTYMIATISSDISSYNETLSTLRYASNAKKIINKVKINEDSTDKIISILKNEIEQLKKQLNDTKYTKNNDNLLQLQEELAQREQLIKEKEKSWEQKLQESREISRAIQEELKQRRNTELQLIKQLEEEKLSQIKTKEEYEKKQITFEKEKLLDTAISLQQHYENKINEIKRDLEQQLAIYKNSNTEKLLEELKEKNIIIANLNDELAQCQKELTDLKNKINHIKDENKDLMLQRFNLSRQVQQLQIQIKNMTSKVSL